MLVSKIKAFTFLVLAISFATSSIAPSLPDLIIKKIDSLYTKWNSTNTPGCAIGRIMHLRFNKITDIKQ